MAQVHIGKKIKEVVSKSHYTVTEFAGRINRSRDVAYKIFAKENIDTGLLQKISEVLEHDFFNYYSHELPMVREGGRVGYAKKTDLISSLGEELRLLKRRLQEMEEKYETLQKLNRLQEEKLESLKKKKKK